MLTSTVIILGAGRPYRGESPSALAHTRGERRVLDWIMDAFRGAVNPEFHFVGGYRVDEVVREYPDIRLSVNPHWTTSGSLGSLLVAPLVRGRDTYISYADIVFRRNAVELARDSTGFAVALVDRTWKTRYPSRLPGDVRAAEKVRYEHGLVSEIGIHVPVDRAQAEFVGLVKLSPAATDSVVALKERASTERRKGGIPELLSSFVEAGLDVRALDVEGEWAELNAPQDLARFVLGTKAETLERLRPLVRASRIGEVLSFTVGQWRGHREGVLGAIRERFGNGTVVVRSSAVAEDGWNASKAGESSSVLNIAAGETGQLINAVDHVIASYDEADERDQVLVQHMLSDVQACGVAMTRTLDCGAPYYVFTYDESGRTDTVTSGWGEGLKTVILHRSVSEPPADAGRHVAKVVPALREVEALIDHDSLDCEFAVTLDGGVHLLQARPIAVKHSLDVPDSAVEDALGHAERKFLSLQKTAGNILGRSTYFAIMPDWNPAEIIGMKPRRLAWSLYRYLVTDEVWAVQRAQYGYRDVRPQPLMVSFAGQPYIDVRADFNSFIPASVSDGLAERLVDHYLEWLLQHPHFQDKVEFEVVFTCRTLDFMDHARARLISHGFSEADVHELEAGLAQITRGALDRADRDMEQIALLEERFTRIMAAGLAPIERAHALLEDCRRLGTLPFAHLARTAFVATILLRSLERMGVLSRRQCDDFLATIQTVAQQFEADACLVSSSEMAWDAFVERYGHLRPGTYEITSPAYREQPERFLRPLLRTARKKEKIHQAAHPWDSATCAAIESQLERAGMPCSIDRFVKFLRAAIQGREQAKFVFTRNLSAALDALQEFGADHGLTRDQLSYVGIDDLLAFRMGPPCLDPAEWLRTRVEEGTLWHSLMRLVELPPLIKDVVGFRAFERPAWQPNFVGDGTVTGESADLSGGTDVDEPGEQLAGRIVLIPRADPGYDWLFGHRLLGLITMYGGVNSHMAVRAAELRLPAAIGVGETLYRQLAGARELELDCAGRRIRVLR